MTIVDSIHIPDIPLGIPEATDLLILSKAGLTRTATLGDVLGFPGWTLPFGAVGDGVTDDSAAIQAAIDGFGTSGGMLLFPYSAAGYKFSDVRIKQSNITLDFQNSPVVSVSSSSTPMIRLIPQSLVTSGRLTGADYPASWKNGATPLPVDGDFDTMMHEDVTANRLTNIKIKNAVAGASCTQTFLVGYSVDGFELTGCNLAPVGFSAYRLWHSSKINVHNNTLGGSGTYVGFLCKCTETRHHDNTFTSTTALRHCSHKGILHLPSRTIFQAFAAAPTQERAVAMRVTNNTVNAGIDGFFFDTVPDPADDPVGEQGGTPIGFTKGDWMGRGVGFLVANNNVGLFNADTSGAQGRAVWASAPHRSVRIANNIFLNAGVFASGIQGLEVENNTFYYSAQIGRAIDVGHDTPGAIDGQFFSVSGNTIRSWIPVGVFTYPIRIGMFNGRVVGNSCYNPATGITEFIRGVNGLATPSDYISYKDNKIYSALSLVTCITSAGTNTHGFRTGNISTYTATNAIAVDIGLFSGVGSIGSGATTTVITHGASYTPALSDITITFGEQGTNDYGRWWVSNITSTQFTVNVSADPGVSNLDFSWKIG